MNFAIISDTTCDLPAEYTSENHIDIIPLYYSIDGVVYGDDKQLEPTEFYSIMRGGSMPTTMASNPDTTEKIYRKHLDNGEDILVIAFSSALSSSYNTYCMVANQLKDEYPDRKIIVVDSLCASMGEGLFVYKAVTLRTQGKSIDETAKWLEENKKHLCHQFTVDNLFHLHRGGRVSKTVAILGTMINVKPVLHVDDEGRLTPLNNVRGRKKSLNALVDNMVKLIDGYDNDMIMIGHGDCEADALYVKEQVEKKTGLKNFMINYICPTIGTHSGPDTIALFFMGEKR